MNSWVTRGNTKIDDTKSSTKTAKLNSKKATALTESSSSVVVSADSSAEELSIITSWLKKLQKLQGVPFEYLVPNENMLPPESIRIFQIDQNWMEALVDGASSVGRTTQFALDHDRAAANLLRGDTKDSDIPVCGFLLRSAIVAGWPGLMIKAFASESDTVPVPLVRQAHLAKDVMLCLFTGDFTIVKIQQPLEGLHFGADFSDGAYTKELRSLTAGADFGTSVTGSEIKDFMRSGASRVIDIESLQSQFDTALKPPHFTSAEFAVEMLETAIEGIVTITKK